MKAVSALGLDGAGVEMEAQLNKLLMYEEGGHFTFHGYPKKEKGAFASLVLQLPTEKGYTGGKVVVKLQKQMKEFECHMVSAIGFCYIIFFADCLHELREIKSGTRLCLAFDLVKRDSSSDAVDKTFTPDRLNKVEAALEPWFEEVTTGTRKVLGRILYIPLKHKYTEEHLSFLDFKQEESIVAELLKECKDKNGKQWLDLHLFLVTKHRNGSTKPCGCGHMEDNVEEDFKTDNWVGSDGSKVPFKSVGIDVKTEVVVCEEEDPFDSEPDEEYYTGDAHAWYHRAMLVAWPKARSVLRACEASISRALDILEKISEISDSEFHNRLHEIILYCECNALIVWEDKTDSNDDDVTPRLLNLCTKVKAWEDVPRILFLLGRILHRGPNRYYYDRNDPGLKVGVRNAEVAKAIANTIQVFGWDLLSFPVIKLAKRLDRLKVGRSWLTRQLEFLRPALENCVEDLNQSPLTFRLGHRID